MVCVTIIRIVVFKLDIIFTQIIILLLVFAYNKYKMTILTTLY